ncbi:MAG TPA: isochorismatase family protein [Micropepsaceae bacterium]|nr:isochorismatase family protein [Micropepsaceae bacterium]
MNTVVNLRDFRERGRELPTLLLIDLHHNAGGSGEPDEVIFLPDALANCRAALCHARACGIPVAFTRQVVPPASMLASPVYPRWFEGLEPKRWDMVFDRQRPSCYASAEFRDVADEIGGNYVIAGRFGELSCLSTAIDAFHRDHRPTVLADALICQAHGDLPNAAMLRAVTCILSHYADTLSTQPWIRATSRRVGAIK